MKAFDRYSRNKIIHEWQSGERPAFLVSLCQGSKAYRDVLDTLVDGKRLCKNCERIEKREAKLAKRC